MFHLLWFDEPDFLNYKWNSQCSNLASDCCINEWLIDSCIADQKYHLTTYILIWYDLWLPNSITQFWLLRRWPYHKEVRRISPKLKGGGAFTHLMVTLDPFGQNSGFLRPCQHCFHPSTQGDAKNLLTWATSNNLIVSVHAQKECCLLSYRH